MKRTMAISIEGTMTTEKKIQLLKEAIAKIEKVMANTTMSLQLHEARISLEAELLFLNLKED